MPSSHVAKTSSIKRKKSAQSSRQKKRIKLENQSLNSLPWTTFKRPLVAGLDGDDGILELEEVDGVEVVYEETPGGKVVKFNVLETVASSQREDDVGIEPDDGKDDSVADAVEDSPSFDSSLLPEWIKFALHPHLQNSLHAQKFLSPTPIQAAALQPALSGKDVVGVAQTGSGKTLAYGLPILNQLLSQPHLRTNEKRRLQALILAPTRELALQVTSHLNACLPVLEPKETGGEQSARPTKRLPLVSCAAIVGGMSSQKQRRVLDRGVDILVATPGRLWDIMQEDEELSEQIKHIHFLVLDEADRMIEAGHFAELDNILRLTMRPNRNDEIHEGAEESDNSEESRAPIQDGMQTFVFSATLSKDLQRNLKRPKSMKRGKKKHHKPITTLDDLLLRLDFRDPEPEIIDLSPVGGIVSTLQESKVECLSGDKDAYLYYFLLRYPGRSLVFLASIDGIRRLSPILELLHLKAFPLHSQLEQRQRLKNLDRFKATPNGILLATDIAARGLDIPEIDHVIHYQIPRSADAYIHRNGRTARAMRKGFSMLLCAPDEKKILRALFQSLERQDTELSDLPVELNMLDKLKARVMLARQIDTAQHKVTKANHERNWMKETAEAMEIELDSDFYNESDEEKPSNNRQRSTAAKNSALKLELKKLLAQPLIVKGVSPKYITSGSRPIVDDILAGNFHEAMVGLKKSDAGSDIIKRKKKGNFTKAEEEWQGLGSS
ncbi:DEAD-domain-containing protein [Pluteus cervinus]|uniref:DEAD-domain-containing protein n=1 Tax=Pluteus cervinus TaxID=181527 RepID=A0ACD3B672_9AGAR|nr:DEAD-domain-containing protein [Pluteus cervinus]